MGVVSGLREELKLPDLIMQYEEGGRVELWSFKDKQVRLTAPVSMGELKSAIADALAE